MDEGEATATILFLVLLFVLMILYGFSQSLRQLNLKEIDRDFEKSSTYKKRIITKLIHEQTRYLEIIQFMITITILLIGLKITPILQNCINTLFRFFVSPEKEQVVLDAIFSSVSELLGLLLLSFFIVSFVYIISRKLALKYSVAWIKIFVYPVSFLCVFFYPFTYIYRFLSFVILKLFRIKSEHDATDVTEEEIISMVNEGQEQGVLQASEAELIHNIFEYSDKEAQDIMTPRKNIHAIDGELRVAEAVEIMLEGRNSRYPVFLENLDHVIGILNLKDALRLNRREEISNKAVKSVAHLLRKVEYIPETRKIDALLKTMQSSKTQIVVVIDEYGQTTGLITMEDILEEIVGNIMDEYDVEDSKIREKSEFEFIVDGMMYLEEMEERFGIDFQDVEFDTLNGFIISKMDKVPSEQDCFEMDYDGYHFKVLQIENRMIKTCLLTRLSSELLEL